MSEEKQKLAKSMLIVKTSPSALKGVEQFLRNRDWSLATTHELKDAIVFLSQHKPSFVLICVDHANSKMKKLPKIIVSAFPCCVMVYAEKPSTGSFKLLMDSEVEYKINPPITGPAIERAVNKYIRDLEQASKQHDKDVASAANALNKPTSANQTMNSSNAKGDFEFNLEVKGSGQKPASFISLDGKSQEPAQINSLAQTLLSQLNNDDWEAPKVKSTPGPSAAYTPSHYQKDKNAESLSYQKSTKPGKTLPSEIDLALEKGAKKSSVKSSAPEGQDHEANQIGVPAGQNHNANQSGIGSELLVGKAGKESQTPGSFEPGAGYNPSAQDIQISKAKNNSSTPQHPGVDPDDLKNMIIPESQNKTPSDLPWQPAQPTKKTESIVGKEIDDLATAKEKNSADSIHVRKDGFFNKDSVFVKGVNHSLDETVIKGDGRIENKLEESSHFACIIVESARFSGYLVAAMGKNKKIDNHFVELIRIKLMKFLKDNGETIDNESNLQLKVRQVDFEGWAIEYAQFLRKSVHKGNEVAMAFFPFATAQTPVGESATATMVSIKTEDIQTDTPLEFNMYLYLPSNKKYILYTPEGGLFLSEQKKRLSQQGVLKMHIQKEDVQNLSKFKAQNHLNSLIKDFESKSGSSLTAPKKKKAA